MLADIHDAHTCCVSATAFRFLFSKSSLKLPKAKTHGSKYKPVDKRIKPVPGVFPEDARVTRQFPEDPLLSLPTLPSRPTIFVPTERITSERLEELNINPHTTPEEMV